MASERPPAIAGIRTPPTISATAVTKPIAFALRLFGTASEGTIAATNGIVPTIA